uniref:Bloodthirsty-related gene family, member 1 n=1 Tax=Sinocyclocheilus grahami TaxID=75366 RepID=A0A672K2T7_SINGR
MPFSRNFLSEEQLLCSICLDVFDNPVSTPCGHSFCMTCIGHYWDSVKHCQCPLCKQTFKRKPDLHINRTLREIIEQFKRMKENPGASGGDRAGREAEEGVRKQDSVDGTVRPVPLCPKHHRNLELFCRSDLECVCVECGQTEHQSHDITCAEKEWQSHKTEIQEMTKERMQKVDEIKQSLVDMKMLSEHEVQRSMQLFGALISSLERSQAGLLEVTEINRRSAEHQAELMIRELEQEITELRKRGTALAKLAQTENYITGLKGYSDVSAPMSMKDWTGVSLTCDLGTKAVYSSVCQLVEQFKEELQKVPARIQEYAVDVTLDTNTAHPRLILSEDKKKVWCGERHQQVPINHERFDRVVCVLGCEGFTSGRHYWEVEVDGKTDWDLGVASHSCNRKGKITVSPSNGYWFLSLRDKSNYAFRTEPSTALPLSLRPQKIGLFVDYEKGQLSFYNVDAKMHIYTFMDNFSETIYPFFSPCTNKTGTNDAPLVITPVLLD